MNITKLAPELSLRALLLFAILITACSGKVQTFHFDSNVDHILVSSGEQSCVAPCKLELGLNSGFVVSNSAYFNEREINAQASSLQNISDSIDSHANQINTMLGEFKL
ncbi:MAG: hypothetical protein LBV04_06425 [Deferribacteraceae bacterium]|jgi:hypothetical protein|nr:hypothetical protein [Deferribacteraceae bacterium]